MTKLTFALLVSAQLLAAAQNLPIGGISHVGFRVADLDKTRAFYTGVLGFQQAFDQKDATGKTTLAVLKINETEFLEFSPGIPAGTTDHFTHIAFLTDKLEALRQAVLDLGLMPPELRTGRDRTRNFSIKDPDGHRVEFVQYEPDSMHAQARGKFADARRVSTQLDRVGIPAANKNQALSFYRDTFGLIASVDLLPQGDPVKLIFEVPSLRKATETLQQRGMSSTANIKDPDGTPIEFVEAAAPSLVN